MGDYTMNFYGAFTVSYLTQLAWFYKKIEGKRCVSNFKTRLLPKFRKLNCLILSNLDDSDMETSNIKGIIDSKGNELVGEIFLLIQSELSQEEQNKFLNKPISPLNDPFFRKISSIFKVSIVLKDRVSVPYKVLREGKFECNIGVVLILNDANFFYSDFLCSDRSLDELNNKEPYQFKVSESDLPAESAAEKALLRKMADILKSSKLYMSIEDRQSLGKALMLDERFIELRNDLLLTTTCKHFGFFKLFDCNAMHCLKCLKEELRNSEIIQLSCPCGTRPYSDKNKEEARKVVE